MTYYIPKGSEEQVKTGHHSFIAILKEMSRVEPVELRSSQMTFSVDSHLETVKYFVSQQKTEYVSTQYSKKSKSC